MPETKSGPLLPRESLELLYTDCYPELEGKLEKSALMDLAARLSEIGEKQPPWTWKYLSSILRGHKGITISRRLSNAIAILGAVVDGQHILLARAHPIQTYSINGNVEKNAVIFHQSRRCANLRCQLPFVPNHPRRKRCFICSPPRRKR